MSAPSLVAIWPVASFTNMAAIQASSPSLTCMSGLYITTYIILTNDAACPEGKPSTVVKKRHYLSGRKASRHLRSRMEQHDARSGRRATSMTMGREQVTGRKQSTKNRMARRSASRSTAGGRRTSSCCSIELRACFLLAFRPVGGSERWSEAQHGRERRQAFFQSHSSRQRTRDVNFPPCLFLPETRACTSPFGPRSVFLFR